MLFGSPDGREVSGENGYMCMCMAELHCYAPETIKTLLISYIPILNKKFKKKEKTLLTLEIMIKAMFGYIKVAREA